MPRQRWKYRSRGTARPRFPGPRSAYGTCCCAARCVRASASRRFPCPRNSAFRARRCASRCTCSPIRAISKEIFPIAQEHHRALIEAIERREGARAESVGREHARLTRRNLEEALADQTFLETVPGARLIRLRSVN